MGNRLPDFILIGAMKGGTSTLHEQLALRSGLFLSDPKEPNFFSDDAHYDRGMSWYGSLFSGARADQRCGESSTHYTKLPTFPRVVERMRRHLPQLKLIYVMRDPVERIVSQYIHEWTQREVQGSIDEAVRRHERFVAYSCYARQLEPFLDAYGSSAILPIAFERLIAEPDTELARVCRFIGDPTPQAPCWSYELPPQNVSQERLRRSPFRDFLVSLRIVRAAKDRLPQRMRDRVKSHWQMRERPQLEPGLRGEVEAQIDRDLARLGAWLGLELDCRGWREQVRGQPLEWIEPPGDGE